MRLPILSSIRSNDSTVRQQYDSFDDEEEESLPPPPPPLPAPPSSQYDPSSIPPWSPDDVSAMTALSGIGTMSNVEASEPNQGERYVDGVPPSPTAAVELELAIYERIEKARKVECDLAKDGQNRRNSRKQKLCIVAVLLLAIIVAIAIGVTRTAKITEGDPIDLSEVKTNGPFIRDDLIMLVGVPSETDLTSEATRTLEENYCAFFVKFYNKPHELDWLRANLDIAECSVEVLDIERRRLNEDVSSGTGGLVIKLNQTLILEYPNTETFTYGIKTFIDHVVSEPFKDDVAVASFVKKLKNQSSTDEFSSLVDIHFAPKSTETAEIPVSLPTGIPPAVTEAPSKAASIVPPSANPTINPTKAPTPKPTNLPREDDKDKDKDEKGKDKKKNAKGKV